MATPTLQVYSGKCRLCDTGVSINRPSHNGADLHTGDIVMVWHGEYLGTDIEAWYPSGGLTVVVMNQYESFSDGSVKANDGPHEPYVMGIRTCGFDSPDWQIHLVKKFSDVIDGEHWAAYGFSYKATGTT